MMRQTSNIFMDDAGKINGLNGYPDSNYAWDHYSIVSGLSDHLSHITDLLGVNLMTNGPEPGDKWTETT